MSHSSSFSGVSSGVFPTVTLHDATTAARLTYPHTEAQLIKRCWLPMMQQGSVHFINNLNTKLRLLAVDDLLLPVTVNRQAYDNSYVCSFYAHYITYAKDELTHLNAPVLEYLLARVLTVLGYLLKQTAINKVVIVNNWMLSTNLYPPLSAPQLVAITQHLQQVFPDHAIAFRSINSATESILQSTLPTLGYQLIGSRQVYLSTSNQSLSTERQKRKNRYLKQDFKLFQTSGYEIIDITQPSATELSRIVELYNLLYLHKYSFNNPQFNHSYVALTLKSKFLTLKGLYKNGRLDAVVGFYIINGVMTTPLLGYDTRLPKSTGLYRMLTACLIQEGEKRNLTINQSSGAASFKWRRGFTGWVEYSAIFHRHLPLHRRMGWWLLGSLIALVAIPLIKKYKL